MSGQPSIRQATREDVPTILSFIRTAAGETDALENVQATESKLLTTLSFAPSPLATGENSDHVQEHKQDQRQPTSGFATPLLLIAPDNTIAGMAIYYPTYSTWLAKPGIRLEELYVVPGYRNRRYAKMLIVELGRRVKELGGERLEWVCLKGNEKALGFYDKLGAERQDEWVGLKVEGEALEGLVGD